MIKPACLFWRRKYKKARLPSAAIDVNIFQLANRWIWIIEKPVVVSTAFTQGTAQTLTAAKKAVAVPIRAFVERRVIGKPLGPWKCIQREEPFGQQRKVLS